MASVADWADGKPTAADVPPYSVFAREIQQSPQDDRSYRIIKLQNGLTATLVHDAKADKAAASLDVAVGHLSDPADMPGLAHFCEHLLFMGTEQYPKENEYSEYLAKNNGGSNAYTSTTNTNYHFSVSSTALEGALARFSTFFHSPLFAPSCTTRELNAVDSEHKKNHQADNWRAFQLGKHLSKEGHVWSKFGSGNKESLSAASKLVAKAAKDTASLAPSPIPSRIASPTPSVASASSSEAEADGGPVGRETRRRVVEWWSQEYCASRMHLCVFGKESLDELAELTSKLFSPVSNRTQEPLPRIKDHPFGPNEMGTLVKLCTIMSFHAIELSFPLEDQLPLYKHAPADLLSHFIGHEGPGSLHSYLKTKGWITDLSSGAQDQARGIASFKVTIHLTQEGFQNHREVLLAAFKYISLLRSSSPLDEFHQRESHVLSSIRFRFLEKQRPESYAVWIAEHMAWPVPMELLLSAPIITWDWDETGGAEQVSAILQTFTADRARAVLMAKAEEHPKLLKKREDGTTEAIDWKTEPWYGTQYHVERFDEELIKASQQPNDIPQLFLPGPNEFIPTNLDVEKREVVEPQKRPHLIRETQLSTLWHKKDDQFWVPKSIVVLDIRSPLANASPRDAVLTRLYSDIVNDALAEFSYDADLAGLSYTFMPLTTGMYIAMNGYNDKMAVLAKHVLEKIKGIVINPERLNIMKEKCKRDWENFFLGQSYQLSEYYGQYLLAERRWTHKERLAELSSITAEEVQKHVARILAQVNLRVFVNGNMYKDEAIAIAEEAEKALGVSPVPGSELEERSLILPQSSNYIWRSPIPNPNQANSALTYYTHVGSSTDAKLSVTTALLTQILKEPAFNILRTKEQLGYIVSCGQWELAGSTARGIRIVVQSEKSPGYLEERVEKFLEGMKTTIEEMKAEEFEEQKAGLDKKWSEKNKNLQEEAGAFMGQIMNGQLDFLKNEKYVGLLKSVTKEEVLDLFLSRVHPASPTRAKLSVHMQSQKPRPAKVSTEAAKAFESQVTAAGLPMDDAAIKEAFGGDATPTVEEFEKYWSSALADKEQSESLLASISTLAKAHPVPGEGEDGVREGVTYIDDIKAFKNSLKLSPYSGPVVEWGDLPVSKF